MIRWFLLVGVVGYLGACTAPTAEPTLLAVTTSEAAGLSGGSVCDAGDVAFVRRGMLHLVGRWPRSVREMEVMLDAVRAIGRDAWVEALMTTPEFVDTWEQMLRDALFVPRNGPAAVLGCRGGPRLVGDQGELAAFLRDHGPLGTYAVGGTPAEWTTGDVIRSAITLDDLSMLFRVEPFLRDGCLTFEVEDINDELSNRRTSAQVFERAFLNRRLDCMACHNSEFSVTGSEDPTKDRTWEIRGLFEKGIFGASVGRDAANLDALFRVDGMKVFKFVADAPNKQFWKNGEGFSPWGMAAECGKFKRPEEIVPDPGGQTGFFVRDFGDTASLYDLEGVLREGLDDLRKRGLVVADNGAVEGPMSAAWLLSASFAERVYEELIGLRLTIAHAFPRNRHQHDLLEALARTFVDKDFSLRALVKAVVLHPLFNEGAPASCAHADAPYGLPAIFNPWTPAEEQAEQRLNGAGDAVVRIPPIALLRTVAGALEWSEPPVVFEFDASSSPEVYVPPPGAALVREVGAFMSEQQTGFRGASFQEAIAWEFAVGRCRDPFWVPLAGQLEPADWISRLLEEAPTIEAAVSALKDRLLNDPDVSDPEERALLEALVGAPLTSAPGGHEEGFRRVCVAFLRAPELHLEGLPPAPRAGVDVEFTAAGTSRKDFCDRWKPAFSAHKATCSDEGELTFQ